MPHKNTGEDSEFLIPPRTQDSEFLIPKKTQHSEFLIPPKNTLIRGFRISDPPQKPRRRFRISYSPKNTAFRISDPPKNTVMRGFRISDPPQKHRRGFIISDPPNTGFIISDPPKNTGKDSEFLIRPRTL